MTDTRRSSQDTRIDMVIGLTDGSTIAYTSARAGAKIGGIDSTILRDGQGRGEWRIPPHGSIEQLCEAYPSFGATGARLHFPGYGLVFEDQRGNGTVTNIVGSQPARFRSIAGPLTMKKAFAAMCSEWGRNISSLFEPTKGKLSAADVPEIVSSCGSKIKLIVNDRDYTKLELLHAVLPPRPESGASIVQRYSKGEDILHVFTCGRGRFLRTTGGRSSFESIPFEVTSDNLWEVTAVAPDEYYQVINDGSTELEYFWAFVDHEDAFNTGGLMGLTRAENDRQGWGFFFDAS